MPERLDGQWCLIGEREDEVNIPSHHVAFSFRESGPGQLDGAVINRMTGEETSLPNISFDGSLLQLRLPNQPEGVYLRLTPVGQKFEGRWTNPAGEAVGPTLKLVRAKAVA